MSATPPSEPEPEEKPQKKSVSVDDLYRRSSQYQLWSYTASELENAKLRANENGRGAALRRFEAARDTVQQEQPAVFAQHGAQLGAEILELVTFDEEQKYLYFFAQQIVQVCNHFNMPTQVKATAISFFKKFYLVNSVMDYRPKGVIYTIVFLAAKLENYFISIDSFCARLPKTKALDVLDTEFVVLQSLKFTLLVHHPFRPLYGFFLDMQLVLLHPQPVMYDVNIDTIGKLYDNAKKWLNDHALLSDVAFLYTPPQIALAAMYDLDKKVTERYLRIKFLQEQDSGAPLETIDEDAEKLILEERARQKENYDMLVKTIKKCIQQARATIVTSKEESTKIDEKCFFTLNPARLLKKRIKALTGGDSV